MLCDFRTPKDDKVMGTNNSIQRVFSDLHTFLNNTLLPLSIFQETFLKSSSTCGLGMSKNTNFVETHRIIGIIFPHFIGKKQPSEAILTIHTCLRIFTIKNEN